MAIIFEMWAECLDESGFQRFIEHFQGLEHKLLTGREIRFTAHPEKSEVDGITVWSPQIGRGYGIETLQDALEATEAGIFLYHRLKTAPDFKFAHVGWDAEKITSADLPDYIDTGINGSTHLNGCDWVLNDELYRQLGSPQPLRQFREGYWWTKYNGERYTPLRSADQAELNELCKQLLPGSFDR